MGKDKILPEIYEIYTRPDIWKWHVSADRHFSNTMAKGVSVHSDPSCSTLRGAKTLPLTEALREYYGYQRCSRCAKYST